jgi:hypothetical protein
MVISPLLVWTTDPWVAVVRADQFPEGIDAGKGTSTAPEVPG